MAVQRIYIPKDFTAGVEHFPERRERRPKKRHTLEEFMRILEAAPIHLRVAIALPEQTGKQNVQRTPFAGGRPG